MGDLRVGVIGGMGPDATVDFMARVLALTPASGDHDHIRMLVDQDPKIQNRQRAILGSGESPGPRLAAIAARLEACGCGVLVMPCNTAHVFLDEILDATEIPFLSIIDVTIERVREMRVARAGLLASAACLEAGVYQSAMQAAGVEPVVQDKSELADLTLAIGRIKSGDHGAEVRNEIRRLATALVERGAEAVVLACTELPIVLEAGDVDADLVSSSDLLAEATVAVATGNAPLPGR
jgi:aspartate racemase